MPINPKHWQLAGDFGALWAVRAWRDQHNRRLPERVCKEKLEVFERSAVTLRAGKTVAQRIFLRRAWECLVTAALLGCARLVLSAARVGRRRKRAVLKREVSSDSSLGPPGLVSDSDSDYPFRGDWCERARKGTAPTLFIEPCRDSAE